MRERKNAELKVRVDEIQQVSMWQIVADNELQLAIQYNRLTAKGPTIQSCVQ